MKSAIKIALLCSGLGHIARGHEVFAQSLMDLLSQGRTPELDITLFKGGGTAGHAEQVVANIPRNSDLLDHIHPPASARWADAVREMERQRIEHETFAYAALAPLLQGDFDVLHCLEREVCAVLHANRHLFRRIPRILFSNGGAIPAAELPPCDFIQEHTPHNMRFSDPKRAFMIPHGVDLTRFKPGLDRHARRALGIADDRLVVVSVGTIGINHKRMDHLIREVAPVADELNLHLLIVGQESAETPFVKQLGEQLLGPRVTFTRVAHEDLPQTLAAADIFALGSVFETFGIAYIEAMAMGLPVICTDHPNQKLIVKSGIFIDMKKEGELTRALCSRSRAQWAELGAAGVDIVRCHYDLQVLRQQYVQAYSRIAATPATLPIPTVGQRLRVHAANGLKHLRRTLAGQARGSAS